MIQIIEWKVSELNSLRERRFSEKGKSHQDYLYICFLTSRIVDLMVEIILLGGEFDSEGFIISC